MATDAPLRPIEPDELDAFRRYLDQESLAASAWDW